MNRARWLTKAAIWVLFPLSLIYAGQQDLPQYLERLEIHYINVEQGECNLVLGPNGTAIFYDAGTKKTGALDAIVEGVSEYLQRLGINDRIDYLIVSHRDDDHYNMIPRILQKGYLFDNYFDNGSSKKYKGMSGIAEKFVEIQVGTEIDLGNGAKAICVAENGRLINNKLVSGARKNENDRSVSLIIKYGKFDYILTGDLGGGTEKCTNRSTNQVDVETPLVTAIMPGGDHPILSEYGVEVAHVGHHGSESSTNSYFMNRLSPSVACIAVGDGQGKNFKLPRKSVVNNVLHGGADCVNTEYALVLQTEEGKPKGKKTSIEGYCVGDIIISTDGKTSYTIDATERVFQGPKEKKKAGIPKVYKFDEDRY